MKKIFITLITLILLAFTAKSQSNSDSLNSTRSSFYMNQSAAHLKSSVLFGGASLAIGFAIPVTNYLFQNKDVKYASNDIMVASSALFAIISLGEMYCVANSWQKATKYQKYNSDFPEPEASQTSTYYMRKSGKQFKKGLTLNLAAAALIGGQMFIEDYGYKNILVNKNGTTGYEIQKRQDYTINNIMITTGAIFSTLGIIQFYRGSHSLVKAGKQNNFSFVPTPLGAVMCYKF